MFSLQLEHALIYLSYTAKVHEHVSPTAAVKQSGRYPVTVLGIGSIASTIGCISGLIAVLTSRVNAQLSLVLLLYSLDGVRMDSTGLSFKSVLSYYLLHTRC